MRRGALAAPSTERRCGAVRGPPGTARPGPGRRSLGARYGEGGGKGRGKTSGSGRFSGDWRGKSKRAEPRCWGGGGGLPGLLWRSVPGAVRGRGVGLFQKATPLGKRRCVFSSHRAMRRGHAAGGWVGGGGSDALPERSACRSPLPDEMLIVSPSASAWGFGAVCFCSGGNGGLFRLGGDHPTPQNQTPN